MQKKIKKGDAVIVSNNGLKEVGVCKLVTTKQGKRYYNVLLEKGSWLQNITDDPKNIIHVVTQKLKPLNGDKLIPLIDASKYDYDATTENIPNTTPDLEI